MLTLFAASTDDIIISYTILYCIAHDIVITRDNNA